MSVERKTKRADKCASEPKKGSVKLMFALPETTTFRHFIQLLGGPKFLKKPRVKVTKKLIFVKWRVRA